jgi:PIN domain nuclease of toxin-antitoxin system
VNILLDTHSFLWFIGGHPNLSRTARTFIEDDSHQLFLSIASLWEMAIKVSLNKLSLAQPFDTLIPEQMNLNGIALLDIQIDHVAVVAEMPFYHRDPFDRLLVAQATVEQVPIVSADRSFDAYSVQRLW